MERSAAKKSLKRGPYQKYTPQLRAAIGRHAAGNGVCAATRNYSRVLDKKINESTVCEFKEAYMKEQSRKRMTADDDVEVNALPVQKRRSLLVGRNLDSLCFGTPGEEGRCEHKDYNCWSMRVTETDGSYKAC